MCVSLFSDGKNKMNPDSNQMFDNKNKETIQATFEGCCDVQVEGLMTPVFEVCRRIVYAGLDGTRL